MGRIYEVWPTFHGSALVLHPPLKGKSTVILPWRAIFKNFSPTKVGGNGSLFTPNTDRMSEEQLARLLEKLECQQCGKIFHKEFGLQWHVANDH